MKCMSIGFDNERYIKLQSERIWDRIKGVGGKLYLEFGGKLFDDYHASRVLPGFAPDSKIRMLMQFGDLAEAIIVINAEDIVKNKIRRDINIAYDMEVFRLVDSFTDRGVHVCGLVISQYSAQEAADNFIEKAQSFGLRVYRHYRIAGYPADMFKIVSEDGFGRNEYVKTTKPLVIVSAPGPGSGKMAVCLSQLYHEHRMGKSAGYAKFETFPVWNLPLNDPVNIAYEAATADLSDANMIDPFHLEAYGTTTVNYNRDVEIFPILNSMLVKIFGESPYRSPTDMGVNMAGDCITDPDVIRKAANAEIIRRYFSSQRLKREGHSCDDLVFKFNILMERACIVPEDRAVVKVIRDHMKDSRRPMVAAELPDGTLVTGKESSLLSASSALILNALKILANIEDSVNLITPEVIRSMQRLKVDYLGFGNPRLNINEMLVALSIAANEEPNAERAMSALPRLKGSDVHASYIISNINEVSYIKLGMYLSCEPEYLNKRLFHGN